MDNKYINSSFFFLRGTPDALGELFKNYNESQMKIRNKQRLSPGAGKSDIFRAERDKQNELDELKTETLTKLADIRENAKTKQEIADRHLEKELGGRTPEVVPTWKKDEVVTLR